MAATSGFRFIEYEGEDAADVLVTLLMNLHHPSGAAPSDEHDMRSETEIAEPVRRIGFQPNEEEQPKEPEEEEDESE